ncbi:hypothetical protein ACIOK4_44655 [Streptomyces bottropensis]
MASLSGPYVCFSHTSSQLLASIDLVEICTAAMSAPVGVWA